MNASEVIILVGGLGTRLREAVPDLPKPLAPVAGRPFLAHLLDRFARAGLRRAILASGYRAEMIEDAIGMEWQGMQIVHSLETERLGTGGALRHAARLLTGHGAHVVNGDTWLAYDPIALERTTGERNAAIGMALAHVDDLARYGAVVVDEGRVQRFTEKGGTGAGWINAGAYFFTAAALAALPDRQAFSLEEDVLVPMAAAGRVAAFQDTGTFVDIGVPEDYRRAQGLLASA
jgi:D-glycero-alpha-D-manno-heptose 1-phosphate guanylyltransferase